LTDSIFELLEKLKLLNVEYNSKIVVLIAAGICNLAQKTDIEGGVAIF
jgi:hypothetical protein